MIDDRCTALYDLLQIADPPCLLDLHGQPRGHHVTAPCDPGRDAQAIRRQLDAAYVEHRRQDHGPDISCVVSVSTAPRLRLVESA